MVEYKAGLSRILRKVTFNRYLSAYSILAILSIASCGLSNKAAYSITETEQTKDYYTEYVTEIFKEGRLDRVVRTLTDANYTVQRTKNTRYYFRDGQGRIVKDSIPQKGMNKKLGEASKMFLAGYEVTHYTYPADRTTDRITIKTRLNTSGFMGKGTDTLYVVRTKTDLQGRTISYHVLKGGSKGSNSQYLFSSDNKSVKIVSEGYAQGEFASRNITTLRFSDIEQPLHKWNPYEYLYPYFIKEKKVEVTEVVDTAIPLSKLEFQYKIDRTAKGIKETTTVQNGAVEKTKVYLDNES